MWRNNDCVGKKKYVYVLNEFKDNKSTKGLRYMATHIKKKKKMFSFLDA